MRRFMMGLSAVLIAQAAGAQPDMSLEQYAALMQANREALGELNTAVETAAYEDARVRVGLLRRNFQALRSFWSSRQRADAVDIIGEGMNRLAALEELLGRREVPADAVRAATGAFGGAACAACHDAYREGSAETGFRFRAGVF